MLSTGTNAQQYESDHVIMMHTPQSTSDELLMMVGVFGSSNQQFKYVSIKVSECMHE